MATQLTSGVLNFYPVDSPASDATISTATTLTIPDDATGIIMQAFTADVHYTIDGTTATTSNGFLMTTSDTPTRFDLYPGATISVISASGEIRYHFIRSIEVDRRM